METTEKIVEAYVRYIKGWATIPNIKCPGQFEIDLIAIDMATGNRFHIESGVSVSGSFSKLTAKPFSQDYLKKRAQQASQRRTLGYFSERKFSAPGIIKTLAKYGFEPGNYQKIIVTFGWTEEAYSQAVAKKIDLWDFRKIMRDISATLKEERTYFTDDTLRTLHLYSHSVKPGDE